MVEADLERAEERAELGEKYVLKEIEREREKINKKFVYFNCVFKSAK